MSQDDPQVQMLFSEQWPAFITHDEDVKPFLDRRVEYFSDLDYYVLDDDGAVIAGAWCVPLSAGMAAFVRCLRDTQIF